MRLSINAVPAMADRPFVAFNQDLLLWMFRTTVWRGCIGPRSWNLLAILEIMRRLFFSFTSSKVEVKLRNEQTIGIKLHHSHSDRLS